jgi:hypothetical protein
VLNKLWQNWKIENEKRRTKNSVFVFGSLQQKSARYFVCSVVDDDVMIALAQHRLLLLFASKATNKPKGVVSGCGVYY